jgi:hypothetical protein
VYCITVVAAADDEDDIDDNLLKCRFIYVVK